MDDSTEIIVAGYLFRVQSYNYWVYGSAGLSLQTTIEILKNGFIVGGLVGMSDLAGNTPEIAKIEEENFHTKKGVYHGSEGREGAKKYLQSLSEQQLISALKNLTD